MEVGDQHSSTSVRLERYESPSPAAPCCSAGSGPCRPRLRSSGGYAGQACKQLERGARLVVGPFPSSTVSGEPLDGDPLDRASIPLGLGQSELTTATRAAVRDPADLTADYRQGVLSPEFRAAVAGALPPGALITEPEQLRTYECDALTGHRAVPELVVIPGLRGRGAAGRAPLPRPPRAVRRPRRRHRALRRCAPRRRRRRHLAHPAEPRARDRPRARARRRRAGRHQPRDHAAVAAEGFYYAPDPSSQQVCTIGGNVAENSGGAHCLKRGFTVNHVLAADVVLADGELVTLSRDDAGPDLLGVFVGSEGTLGIAVGDHRARAAKPRGSCARCSRDSRPPTPPATPSRATIAAGCCPSAIEMMDALTIEAVEAAVAPGYPAGAGAVLIVELDGPAAQVAEDSAAVERICNAQRCVRAAHRRDARGACAGVARPQVVVRGDGPDLLQLLRPGRRRPAHAAARGAAPHRRAGRRRAGCGWRASSTPGDGNLHPLVLYDESVEGEPERAEQLATAILDLCIDAGGSLTGEHGVGVDKACSMPKLFSERDLEAMRRLRVGFDPDGLANPGKIFPTPRLCGEVPGALPNPPARAGRTCRASLSRARSRRRPRRSPPGMAVSIAARRGRGRRLDGEAEPRARARAGRPDRDRRGGAAPVGASGSVWPPTARCSRSTRRATRRSGPASRPTSPARAATATGRCATS